MHKENKNYDLIVIGAGPAGMLSAGRAGENGARVLLLEKNNKLGMKLAITGKGRCNITNANFNIKDLVKQYGLTGKFLFSALNKFGPQDVIDFFENRNLATQIERGNRVFPENAKAFDVIDVLRSYLKENNVEILLNSEVKKFAVNKKKIEKVVLTNGQEFTADNFAVCTGGKSYLATGSTGDAYKWLKEMGHKIIKPTPALTSIIVKEKFIKDLEGSSLKNVDINVFQNSKKVLSGFGEAMFTANGLGGPVVIDMSKKIGEFLNVNKVVLEIDFKPALTDKELDQRIQNDFKKFNNKLYKNCLNLLLPQKLIPIIINLSKIDPDKKVNSITKQERNTIVNLLKHFSLQVDKLAGFERAIITAGGVDVKEVDPQTMRSKIISNLFLAGEVLDLDGPTGGYNLQICWSTGFCVGESFA